MIKRVFLLLTAIININNCMEKNLCNNNDELTIGYGMFFAYEININKYTGGLHYKLLECVNNEKARNKELIENEKKEGAISAIWEFQSIDKSGIAYSISSDRSILILDRIKIKKEFQRKGFGTRVLKELIKEFFSHNEAKKILVYDALARALKFYEKLGFRELSPYIIYYGFPYGYDLQMTRSDYDYKQKYNF